MKNLVLSALLLVLLSCSSGGSSSGRTPVIRGGTDSGKPTDTKSDTQGSTSAGKENGDEGAETGGSGSVKQFISTDPNFLEYLGRGVGDPLSYDFCKGTINHLKGEDKASFEIVAAVDIIVAKRNELMKDGDVGACKQGMLDFMLTVTDLNLGSKGIIDLNVVVGCFPNLVKLNLDSNKVLDTQLGLLRDLQKLKTLFVGSNALSTADSLLGIPTLENIDMRSNKISNINFLADMPAVKLVDATNNPLVSVAGLLDHINKLRRPVALTITAGGMTTMEIGSIAEKSLDGCIYENFQKMPPDCAGKRLKISFGDGVASTAKLFFGSNFNSPQTDFDAKEP